MRAQALLLGALVIAAGGCNKATILMPTDADQLREKVRDLSVEVEQLNGANKELKQQLELASKESQSRTGISPDVAAATPRLAAVRVGSPSHFARSGEAKTCVATIYLEPQDGLGRFLQIVGTLDVSLFELSSTGTSRTLGTASFGPLEVRNAWRGGMIGSHYTFEIPMTGEGWNCSGSATVRLAFVDGYTGTTFSSQRELLEVKDAK